ncbi:hypothetical protein OS242_04360 [Tumebacillus sp. DT12]|uniref:LysM domain-containing protein n=1 Tax=Tumebacillus lacus TaxID=2995335 RepID=A0ABT3WZN0_9BACL|nr:hypothetical protein [Tumebacillus lacus]MCX7569183.1 hypothetical protein [Tumebacillus lacus]
MTYVRASEHLASIAARFGVPVLAVMQPNNFFDPRRFEVRPITPQRLVPPVGAVHRSHATGNHLRELQQVKEQLARLERTLTLQHTVHLHTRQIAELERRVRELERMLGK